MILIFHSLSLSFSQCVCLGAMLVTLLNWICNKMEEKFSVFKIGHKACQFQNFCLIFFLGYSLFKSVNIPRESWCTTSKCNTRFIKVEISNVIFYIASHLWFCWALLFLLLAMVVHRPNNLMPIYIFITMSTSTSNEQTNKETKWVRKTHDWIICVFSMKKIVVYRNRNCT